MTPVTHSDPIMKFPSIGQNMPTHGWHAFRDGTTAYVVPDRLVYQVQYFPPGFVTADNYAKIGRQSERIAASCFGTRTPPPSPEPPKPDKGKGRAAD